MGRTIASSPGSVPYGQEAEEGLGVAVRAWCSRVADMIALPALRAALESALAALPPPERFPRGEDADTARRLTERLRRDLLPRLGGDAPLLLVAIAGPNNVGKS